MDRDVQSFGILLFLCSGMKSKSGKNSIGFIVPLQKKKFANQTNYSVGIIGFGVAPELLE